MAKAKKQSEEKTATPAEAKAPKKAPAKKPAAKAAKPAAAGVPLIDTGLAAQTAAKLVARRDTLEKAKSSEGQGETAAFRQFKENVNKPAHGPTSFLQNTAPQKKSNLPFGGFNQQVGKNQTFGADVNRSGVPRRTGG